MTLEARLQVQRGVFALDLRLHVPPAQVVAVLGPNGAGKTTAFQALAGLVPLGGGHVRLDGQVLEDPARGLRAPTQQRPLGVVFQDYLLFPHLSALDNVAFGLRARGQDRRQARAAAGEWLARVGVADLAAARPRSLSGGQAQRVALARALATRPRLLLLDEPLAALDAAARLLVRSELRRHLAAYDGVALLVTHDPVDAMVLADRLLILEQGQLVQEGSAAEVTARPRSEYVARLVGLNLYQGHASADTVTLPGGHQLRTSTPSVGSVFAAVRPAAVALYRQRPDGSPRNVWPGRVSGVERHGDLARVTVDASPAITADLTPAAAAELGLVPGTEVWASVKATEIAVYPEVP